ncbi:YciI family protein [Psychrobacter sp. GP33]|uniref:YciI family protein n=1 Tax=Psychrobacter sp. GP33 TaxID=2758709 RepID=UPI0015FADA00|nr:YciI family protein [Psychrobacter sp. GP33]
MPLFAIIGHDIANSDAQRKLTRTEHLARLQVLDAKQRLLVAGPTPIEHGQSAMSGSIVIAKFNSLDAAKEWASAEPYLRDGVYSHVDIKPFIHVLPKPEESLSANKKETGIEAKTS